METPTCIMLYVVILEREILTTVVTERENDEEEDAAGTRFRVGYSNSYRYPGIGM